MHVPTRALFAIPTLIWGSTWLAITFQFGTVAPELSVVYRFALAGAIVAAWCRATGRSMALPWREHRWLVLFGLTFFGINYLGVYWAEREIPSGLVAVVFSTIVFMTPFAMRVFYGEPLTARALVAAALGVTGVALLFLPELAAASEGGQVAQGIAMALGATFSCAIGNVIAIRNHRAGLATLPSTAWGMFYGAAFALAVAALLGVPFTFEVSTRYVLSLAYLTLFGSVFAFAAYLTLLHRVGSGPVSFISIATPVIALALSTVFEGYRWTWAAFLGLCLAIAGNWLALRKRV